MFVSSIDTGILKVTVVILRDLEAVSADVAYEVIKSLWLLDLEEEL